MKKRTVVFLTVISVLGTVIIVAWIASESLYDLEITQRRLLPPLDHHQNFLIGIMLVAMGAIVGPLIWLAKRARGRMREWVGRRRTKKGLCANCGYDMRASAEQCPECGHYLCDERELPV